MSVRLVRGGGWGGVRCFEGVDEGGDYYTAIVFFFCLTCIYTAVAGNKRE